MGQNTSPWEGLQGPGYHIENLGRPLVFYVPTRNFTKDARQTLECELHDRFGGFTATDVGRRGVWINLFGKHVTDKSVEYEVSFAGKERIPEVARILVNLARLIGEECIYIKAGEDAALIWPKPSEERGDEWKVDHLL